MIKPTWEITEKWLKEKEVCNEVMVEFRKQGVESFEGIDLMEKLITEKRYDWANWLIMRLMNSKQKIQYAVFAVEQVLDIFERKYPDDKRPRKAIEAAKKCIENNTDRNRTAAANAADYAAFAAVYAADYAANYAADYAAKERMRIKIFRYGMKLIKEGCDD